MRQTFEVTGDHWFRAAAEEIEHLSKKHLPAFRCDGCDNGVELEWEYCPWCGCTKDWVPVAVNA